MCLENPADYKFPRKDPLWYKSYLQMISFGESQKLHYLKKQKSRQLLHKTYTSSWTYLTHNTHHSQHNDTKIIYKSVLPWFHETIMYNETCILYIDSNSNSEARRISHLTSQKHACFFSNSIDLQFLVLKSTKCPSRDAYIFPDHCFPLIELPNSYNDHT